MTHERQGWRRHYDPFIAARFVLALTAIAVAAATTDTSAPTAADEALAAASEPRLAAGLGGFGRALWAQELLHMPPPVCHDARATTPVGGSAVIPLTCTVPGDLRLAPIITSPPMRGLGLLRPYGLIRYASGPSGGPDSFAFTATSPSTGRSARPARAWVDVLPAPGPALSASVAPRASLSAVAVEFWAGSPGRATLVATPAEAGAPVLLARTVRRGSGLLRLRLPRSGRWALALTLRGRVGVAATLRLNVTAYSGLQRR